MTAAILTGSDDPTSQRSTVVRTLLVDDVEEVRDRLSRLLARIPTIDVVGVARDGAEAVKLVDELKPTVVLMDMRMPVMDGIAATTQITSRHKDTAVIILSAYGDESLIVEALLSGACSYLLKGAAAKELIDAVHAAAQGQSRLPGLTKPLLERLVAALTAERKLRADAETAQRTLIEQEAENRALATRLVGLLDAAPVGIIETDLADRVLRWNSAAERIYGWSEDHVLGRSDPNPAALEVGSVADLPGGHVSQKHVRSDGTTVDVELAHAVLGDGSGEPTGRIKVVMDVTHRKELEGRLHHQAFHDKLTGLPNRALFIDRVNTALAHARRLQRPVTVLLLDLDGFKMVNDSLGHDAGDQLLVIAARRLAGCLRPEDTLARLGGDEFALLVDLAEESFAPESLADRLLAALRLPTSLHGRPVTLGASIGIAESTWRDDEDAASMIRDADVAMYAAKNHGKGRFERFESGMRDAILERAELETDLRAAVELGQFELHYQPIVQLDTRRLQGVEALLRWPHPHRGQIRPDMFIGMAESVGLMPTLGRWVLHTACAQLARWHAACPERTDLTISVNVSPSQLADPCFVAVLESCLTEHGVNPRNLVLEITEGMLVTQTEQSLAALRTVRQRGVRIAIDDFGTGYSSLAYLRELDVDIIKIDKSFVDFVAVEEDAAALAHTILTMANTLRLHTVAEGIADAAQLARLIDQQCPSGQGYLFSRAVPPETITAMLEGSQQL